MKFEARVGDWAMRKFLSTNLERDAESGGWRWQINLPVLTAALPVLEKTPLGAGDAFSGQVLFVTGGKSRYVVPTDWVEIERHFPKAGLETIAEAGHNPHMETRDAFVRAVLSVR